MNMIRIDRLHYVYMLYCFMTLSCYRSYGGDSYLGPYSYAIFQDNEEHDRDDPYIFSYCD